MAFKGPDLLSRGLIFWSAMDSGESDGACEFLTMKPDVQTDNWTRIAGLLANFPSKRNRLINRWAHPMIRRYLKPSSLKRLKLLKSLATIAAMVHGAAGRRAKGIHHERIVAAAFGANRILQNLQREHAVKCWRR